MQYFLRIKSKLNSNIFPPALKRKKKAILNGFGKVLRNTLSELLMASHNSRHKEINLSFFSKAYAEVKGGVKWKT